MRYKSKTQNARQKFLKQKQFSQEERVIFEKDFQGKDYAYFKSIKDDEILLPKQYSAEATYSKINHNIQSGISRMSIIKYAAAIALLISVSFGIYQFNKTPDNIIASTSYGERKQIDLPDGTTVTLNSLSSVSYSENIHKSDTREIKLSGEAYFDVAKDERRTFIVKTPEQIEIKVLGTKFNVSAYENDENVTTDLYEGAVSIAVRSGDSLRLKPGEQATYNKISAKVEVSVIDYDNSEWIKGSIHFENIALKNIFKVLEREKNITFRISGDVEQGLKLTAKFNNNESVDEILERLSHPGNFSFEIIENIYIIKKQKH